MEFVAEGSHHFIYFTFYQYPYKTYCKSDIDSLKG